MAAANEDLDELNDLLLCVGRLAAAMRRGGVGGEVPLAVVQAALGQLLGESVHGGVPTGRVTFRRCRACAACRSRWSA